MRMRLLAVCFAISCVSGSDDRSASTSALTTFTIPGRVEAEAFTGFSGSTTGKGGTGPYGNLQACSDSSGCGQNVGWIGTAEWFSYDVNVTGTVASVDVRVASAVSGAFHLEVDNVVATSTFTVATGGWQSWTTVTTPLSVSSGAHVIKLVADTGGFNVNYFDFKATNTPPGPAPFYNGCYRDDASRALPIFMGSRSDMTPQLCQNLCRGHHYAGVQYSSECYCGDAVAYEIRPDSECNMPCSGDASQACGGGWRNSIYFVPDYAGCYSDDSTRALPVFKGSRSDMTPQKCQALCVGYNYAGVQYYSECYCGNTLGFQLRPDSECNTPCSGDSSQECGGGWRNSVYSLGDPCYGCWDY